MATMISPCGGAAAGGLGSWAAFSVQFQGAYTIPPLPAGAAEFNPFDVPEPVQFRTNDPSLFSVPSLVHAGFDTVIQMALAAGAAYTVIVESGIRIAENAGGITVGSDTALDGLELKLRATNLDQMLGPAQTWVLVPYTNQGRFYQWNELTGATIDSVDMVGTFLTAAAITDDVTPALFSASLTNARAANPTYAPQLAWLKVSAWPANFAITTETIV